ncbi:MULTISPECIES: NADH-quinone oxidoreductase subunit NuoN [unclassified Sphingomonas]|uniref:NADH-quinone oxidoreductase subunit NuoN n=1 Tax=unclassified Sphingomonas TaxID=196159 RepID=UPI0006FE0B4E|nr:MULTISPECIES: NADH-quinone oxidoreductase subunit NuoN [unclassified Sphingomonas]KQX25511.1 NADH-quinone oxidoreductase subunit N [Sphingomonas sp. Root1294]KQY66501.1 NADH-quinone oxidoreductase subunit N [Sphingomonas sp. Root50]KRB90177.1 NADH-quinone oxidoreductase subunit N [Sphingomonas sp. Root720]
MSMTASLALTVPELILSIGAMLLLMVAAFGGDGFARAIGWGAVALFAAAGFALTGPAGNGGPGFDGLYIADSFAAFAKLLVYISAAVCVIVAPGFFDRSGGGYRAEYPILILFSAVGMGMMVSAGDLLTLYVGLELQSLSAYVLASFLRRDTRSAEAGLKYFVLGALASGILLYGISLIYGFTGTTLFAGISDALAKGITTGQLFGMVFIFAGLAFKISAVPFHMWTPDVYEGAPTPVTAFFASAPKVAGMALLLRVAVEAMGSGTDSWRQIVIFAALASTILGGVAAIGQSSIKRLLAYSSINNVGFALFGLAAGTAEGVAGTMTYMAVYVAMTLGSFICVLQMRGADGQPVETITSLSGLSRSRPGLAAAFAIFMFSLAGIPPLFGFWPKFLVFDALVRAGFWPLAMIGIATSVIGAFYYLKIVKTIYFDDPAPEFAPAASRLEGGLITLAALAVSPLGYLAIPLLDATSMAAARALF